MDQHPKSGQHGFFRHYRAILLGLLLVPVNIYFLLYMEVVTNMGMPNTPGGPYPSTISLFANTILFLIILTVLNAFLERKLPSVALLRGELLVIYVMLVVSTAIVSIDFLDVLVPMMTYPFNFATPENNWQQLIWPHIPKWISVQDPAAVRGYYIGNTNLLSHFRAWLIPVAVWSGVIFVMLFVMFCINTIVRKQWMQHDKLQFPLVELPMQITEPGHRLFRNRLMWLGFSVGAGITLLNGLSFLYPAIPSIPTKMQWIAPPPNPPWNAIGGYPISFYPYAIGLGFLLPVDMLFSCWFFFIAWRLLNVVGAAYGVSQVYPLFPFKDQQAIGAYYLIGLFALWSGRSHLAHVFKTAFVRSKDADEAEGPMRYRTAVFGLIIGTFALIAFFHFIGLRWWVATACIGLYFLIALAVNRMHAEFGPPAHDMHCMGPDIVLTTILGTGIFTAGDRVGMSWFWWFNRAYRSIPIAYQLDGLKIAQRTDCRQRYMSIAMALASVAAVISGFVIYLHFGYTLGASVKMAGHATAFGSEAWNQYADVRLKAPAPFELPRALAILWGMIFAYFLYFMKLRFAWWPFHPLGFAFSTSYSIGTMWLPLMIAWAAKVMTFKAGGLKAYKIVLNFFLGLMLGDFIMGCIWPIIGMIFHISTYSFMQ